MKVKDILPLIKFANFPINIIDLFTNKETGKWDDKIYYWHGDSNTQKELLDEIGDKEVKMISQDSQGTIEITLMNNIFDRNFDVLYQIYEMDATEELCDPVECQIDGYKDIETLKSETEEVIHKLISNYTIPDGVILVEIQITCNNKYYDKDSLKLTIENGKIIKWSER